MGMGRSSSGSVLSAQAAGGAKRKDSSGGDRPISPAIARSPSGGVGLGAPSATRQSDTDVARGDAPAAPRREELAAPARPPRHGATNGVPAPIDSTLTPTITTTLPSPAVPASTKVPAMPPMPPMPPVPADPDEFAPPRKPGQRRKSFHPQPLNTAFSREVLLTSKSGILPGAGLVLDDTDPDAIMTNVEEMLEGFDWTASAGAASGLAGDGIKKKGADAIESRLLDELAALDSVSSRGQAQLLGTFADVLGQHSRLLGVGRPDRTGLGSYRRSVERARRDRHADHGLPCAAEREHTAATLLLHMADYIGGDG